MSPAVAAAEQPRIGDRGAISVAGAPRTGTHDFSPPVVRRMTVAEERTDGWARVLEEMDAMAASLDEEGWRTLPIAAGDAAAVTSETGRTDRHGYAYVVPGDDADTFTDVFVPDGFPRTEVYRAGSGTHLYLLTVLQDPPTETAILLAGAIPRGQLPRCERAAAAAGRMYTHVLRVDGTRLGSFAHDDPEPFFPEDP